MSNSSEFSFSSDMDVEEGTVVASIQVAVQENPINQLNKEVGAESFVERSVHSSEEIEVSCSVESFNQSVDLSEPEVKDDSSVPNYSHESALDKEFHEEDPNSECLLTEQSPSDCFQTQSEINQFPHKSDIVIAENPSIFQKPNRRKKKGSLQVYQRLSSFYDRSKEKVMKAAKEQFADEMKKCTFKPTVNDVKSPKRSFQEFLTSQQRYLNNKNEKVRVLRKKQSEVNESFQPSICENSIRMLQERKLSDSCIKPPKFYKNDFSFKPKTNNRQRLQKRTKSIFDHLYESPKKQSTSKFNPNCTDTNKKASRIHTNKSSEKTVIKKFEQEFFKVYDELADAEGLSYSMYIKLLERMSLLNNEKDLAVESWKKLTKGSEYLQKEPLLHFLLLVMNYKKSAKTHLKYLSFFQNRSKKAPILFPPKYSFKPVLSEKTLKLASSPENRLEFLVNERQGHLEKWKRMQMERDKAELNSLKFKPKTNPRNFRRRNIQKKGSIAQIWKGLRSQDKRNKHRAISLYSLSFAMLAYNREKEEDAKNDEYHDNLKTCTFSPVIRKHLLFRKKPIGIPKGFIDAVHRVRKVRSQKNLEKNKDFKPFSFTIERNSKHADLFKPASLATPITRDGSRSLSESRNPFNVLKSPFRIPGCNSISPFQTDSESEDNPIEISVKLPNGNIERIMIYSEADKLDAVDDFIRQHGLTGDICQQLREGVLAT